MCFHGTEIIPLNLGRNLNSFIANGKYFHFISNCIFISNCYLNLVSAKRKIMKRPKNIQGFPTCQAKMNSKPNVKYLKIANDKLYQFKWDRLCVCCIEDFWKELMECLPATEYNHQFLSYNCFKELKQFCSRNSCVHLIPWWHNYCP